MVKAFFAYALLVIGLPNYLGVIVGAIFMPLAWPFPYPARLAVIQLLNFRPQALDPGNNACVFRGPSNTGPRGASGTSPLRALLALLGSGNPEHSKEAVGPNLSMNEEGV